MVGRERISVKKFGARVGVRYYLGLQFNSVEFRIRIGVKVSDGCYGGIVENEM